MIAKDVEKELDFPINQELLEEATRCMEEWRVIKDRLARIEEHKANVSQSVYERVRDDYEGRLNDATQALLEKKEVIDAELSTLGATKSGIEEKLAGHKHQLEEIKFRNTLGEYTEDEYQEAANAEQEKIIKFETVVNAVENNLQRYEAIFAGEEELFASQEPSAPEEEISELADVSDVAPGPHEVEPITDAAGYVIEEEGPDYFSTPEVEDAKEEREDSATSKGIIEPQSGQDISSLPKVVVINGDNAGAAYPIKGTISFGRAESNTVPLRDVKASRQHAQIKKHGNEFIIIDLNSSNGTLVNNEKVEEYVLANGDEIQIGDTLLQFQLGS